MDVLAHGLWAGIGCAFAARRVPLSRATVAWTVALAVLPDVVHALPVLAWVAFGSGRADALWAYLMAQPGQLPALPPAVLALAQHLHCIGHSAVVAAAVTLAVRLLRGSIWIPLYGWWSHILIDVPTHSAQYFPSPVLYPFTMRGFDGIAWTEPWFLALNYLALGAAAIWLLRRRRGASSGLGRPGAPRPS